MKKCKMSCGNTVKRNDTIFCSIQCHQDFQQVKFIKRWLAGKEDGIIGEKIKSTSKRIKRYLIEQYGECCHQCGWHKMNDYSKTMPIELHHVDGDPLNNVLENLVILCPNCHSLTETHKSRGSGNGRTKYLRERYDINCAKVAQQI